MKSLVNVVFQSINDSNQIQGTINNFLTLVENVSAGVAAQGTNIGEALGYTLTFGFYLVLLALIFALLPRLIKGFTSWIPKRGMFN